MLQIILGIVISELELEELVSRAADKDPLAHGRPEYFETWALDSWFYGDHVYVGAAVSCYWSHQYFRGRVPSFNQSEARKQCFFACDWLRFGIFS